MFYIIIALLAFCSIVYELILAQALAAFLENTVLRYSVTIGLYMCSMGFGTLLTGAKLLRRPVRSLMCVEGLLTVIGGGVLVWLYLCFFLLGPSMLFILFAHTLIILIGLLTGMELPLLMERHREEKNREAPKGVSHEDRVLAANYAGAFLGPVIFAFVFYPRIGLMATAFLTGGLNALAGAVLAVRSSDTPALVRVFLLAMVCVAGVCWLRTPEIQHYFSNLYLR